MINKILCKIFGHKWGPVENSAKFNSKSQRCIRKNCRGLRAWAVMDLSEIIKLHKEIQEKLKK